MSSPVAPPPDCFPGPDCLGRGAVISATQDAPSPLAACPLVEVNARTLARPERAIAALHEAWATRRRVVVRLAVDAALLREAETSTTPPHDLPPHFEFQRERLHFLIWANNYDCTTGTPRWRLADHAVARLGAARGQDTDLVLPEGVAAWCDGGPREALPVPIVHGESLALGRLALQEPSASEDLPSLQGLADDQAQAVLHRRGAARVIAPAGSGKTRVLAARLQHLLVERGHDADCVTALAYNKRAATELEQRTAGTGARVRTLHALGYEIVRRHREARVVQEADVRQILGSLVTVEPQRGKDPMAPWIEALAEVRLALRPPREVERLRGDVPGLASVFSAYRDTLRSRGVIDHDEQIYGALEILLEDAEERRRMQRQCRHLLVDEFQDLTPAYLMMVRLLSAPGYQVFGVGDDDQVIYGYVGATPDYLVHYDRFFPGAAHYELRCNYRCPPTVVEAASTLLTHNLVRVPKSIEPRPGRAVSPDGLNVVQVPEQSLAQQVVTAVQQLLENGREARQIAVLSRVNSTLLPVQVALAEAGIPHNTPVDAAILDRNGVRAALAWLAVATRTGPCPASLIQETIHRPSRKIRRASSDDLARRAAWTERDLVAWARGLPAWERTAVHEYVADLTRLRSVGARATTADLLKMVRVDIGLETEASTLDSSRSDARGQSHVDDLLALEQLAHLHAQPATFEQWVRERLVPRGNHGVQLSTIHRVKGLEWDHVIVFDATWGLMPHHMAEGQQAMEEERRVFHVALTRGRRGVLVLANQAIPSPYLAEMSRPRAPRRSGEHRNDRSREQARQPVVSRKALANRSPRSSASTEAPSRAASNRDGIVAEIGLPLQAPHVGTISSVEAHRAWLELPSGRRLALEFGVQVKSNGRSGRLRRGEECPAS